ncbi:MAG TPA: hypothetical protein VJQ57_08885 [Acidimicrobiia bacterium]|nr:hypothetical protein [Acidimicrobiia bacterium]
MGGPGKYIDGVRRGLGAAAGAFFVGINNDANALRLIAEEARQWLEVIRLVSMAANLVNSGDTEGARAALQAARLAAEKAGGSAGRQAVAEIDKALALLDAAVEKAQSKWIPPWAPDPGDDGNQIGSYGGGTAGWDTGCMARGGGYTPRGFGGTSYYFSSGGARFVL